MKKELLGEIIKAIENHELQAYYQPQYNPKNGVIGGAEALVRWVKKDGTIIPPIKFIPDLEAIGEVSVVDWFVAEEACKTIKELGDSAVKISVNFGREHAKNESFIARLDKLVNEYGIAKNLIGVEITESDVVADKGDVIDWGQRITDAGYIVSIDDFGSGMSSLSFVKDVPAKVLKIDKSFLDDNCESEKGRITLETVFYLAHRLQLTTIVEGVETKEQLNFINTCDCDYIQGFIFSKPVPHDEFIEMCTSGASVEDVSFDPLSNRTAFGQAKLLINAIYKKFQLIIFSNLTRNSYHIMKKENFIETTFPAIGTYDDGFEVVKRLSDEADHEELDKAYLSENLLAAHARGENPIVRIVMQHDDNGVYHRIAIEDYFMDDDDTNDVFMVTFMHRVDYSEDVFLNNAK